MPFITKIDFSNNRQIKQYVETSTLLSGGTSFGVPFNYLPTGANPTTSAITISYSGVVSTFSGNSGNTTYSWYDNNMNLGLTNLSPLTPSISGLTQNTGIIFTPETITTIDGNVVNLTYTGISFDLTPLSFYDLGSGNYSGTVYTNLLDFLSAGTLDYTGRTIWVDVSGITRTQELIVTKTPHIGWVLTCVDAEGKVDFEPISGISSCYWSAGTGISSIVVKDSDSIASGDNSLASGYKTTASGFISYSEGSGTTANGDYSHAEGQATIADGYSSHAEGNSNYSFGAESHAEGYQTTAYGDISHAEGSGTTALGVASHSEGSGASAFGDYSHAGGYNSIASGTTSFVHGNNSQALGNNTIVFGDNIIGTQSNYTYVESLNIKEVSSGAFSNDIRITLNGDLTTNTSDKRLKENITPLKNSLSKIKQLNGVQYQWKDRKAGGDDFRIGFIAQEVESIEPLLVFTNKVDGYKGIHIDGLIPMLIEAIKELSSGTTFNNNSYIETQKIIAEDNNIDLNFNGNQETAIGGGIKVLNALGENKSADFITDIDGNWVTNNDLIPSKLTIPFFTPNSSSDIDGNYGNITRDEDFIYIKTTKSWKRIKLESF